MFLMRVGNDVRRRGISSVFPEGKRAETLITGNPLRAHSTVKQIFFGGARGAALRSAAAATPRAAAAAWEAPMVSAKRRLGACECAPRAHRRALEAPQQRFHAGRPRTV